MTSGSNPRRSAAPLALLAMVALLAGLWAGLLRMGWGLPSLHPNLAMAHGPLMVCGFLGTLIALERAVGLSALDQRWRWTYAGPALAGAGALLLLAGLAGPLPALLITLGSIVLAAMMAAILRIHVALHAVVMLLGALVWVGGNLLWLFGRGVPIASIWWAGFLVLTIVGERLELSRLLRLSRGKQVAFGAAVVVLLAGILASPVAFQAGARLTGAGMLLLAIWLLLFDIARRTVRKTGLTRYIALALLAGYGWLAFSGLQRLHHGGLTAGAHYDALMHTLFVGFVISMIFAHAPIIVPALTGWPLVYSPAFYAPLALLQVSLLLRIVGDATLQMDVRRWGGLLNELAILLFIALLVVAVRRGRKQEA
ncbi:MAG: hypothetical protein KDI03_20860 [Anaerolineae bacterium]|nr:hypothetical protein [Anaerolineae bacterium]